MNYRLTHSPAVRITGNDMDTMAEMIRRMGAGNSIGFQRKRTKYSMSKTGTGRFDWTIQRANGIQHRVYIQLTGGDS